MMTKSLTGGDAEDVGHSDYFKKKANVKDRVEQSREAAKIYQLPLWPDDKRAMPCDFLASALFAAIHDKNSIYLDDVELANLNGYRVTFKGPRLTQIHADVWQGIMHLARESPEGKRIKFRGRHFLRLIGRHTGKSQRLQLRKWFSDVCATCVVINDVKNGRRFWGSLLPNGVEQDENEDTIFVLEINRDLAKVFDLGHVAIDWQLRTRLKGKPLQLWLQMFFSLSTAPISVADLYKLSGSTAEQLKGFRRELRTALAKLAEAGGHAALIDASDVVRTMAPVLEEERPSDAPKVELHGSSSATQAVLPGVGLPVVSERTIQVFRDRFPGYDVERCVKDWVAWPGSRKATNPHGAFLGFAKRWKNSQKPVA